MIWDILRDARAAGLATLLDLRRPRGADRPVRPPARDAARPDRRRPRPGDGRPRRDLGSYMTGARRRKDARSDSSRDLLCGVARPAPRRRRRDRRLVDRPADRRRDPIDAFREMWKTIDSTESVVAIINRAVPYYVAGVAVAIGFKMNLFNIGVDGQYQLAALFAAACGAGRSSLPAPIHVAVRSSSSPCSVGAAWARDRRHAQGHPQRQRGDLDDHAQLHRHRPHRRSCCSSHLRNRSGGLVAETEAAAEVGPDPDLNSLFEAVRLPLRRRRRAPAASCRSPSSLGVGYHVLLNRSRFGFDLRVSRPQPGGRQGVRRQPEADGPDRRSCCRARVAGLIGLAPLLADPQFGKYGDQFPPGARLHRPVARPARTQPSRRHRRGGASCGRRSSERRSGCRSIGIPQEIGMILQGSFLLAAVIAYEVVAAQGRGAASGRWPRRRPPACRRAPSAATDARSPA